MPNDQTQRRAQQAVERLAKWRALLAGWQLGTRPKGDPESDAVRDHRELTLLLRAEVSALARLLVDKGLVTEHEWLRQLEAEADELNAALAQRFPGVRATDTGLVMDARAAETMRGWRP